MKPLIACVLGALVAVLAGSARPAAAAFPGQNGRVAFASNRAGAYDIFTARPDGSSLLNLTATAGVDELDPAWSADGRRLAFTRDGALSPAAPGRADDPCTGRRRVDRRRDPDPSSARVLRPREER